MRHDASRSVACALLTALGLVVFAGDGARGQETFSLVGTVTDTADGPLPGVTATISDGSDSRVIVTDAPGRFEFTGLLPGTYTVDAALVGFRARTRRVEVGVAPSTRLDMTLRVAPLQIADPVILTPVEQVQRASAIAHIRIATTRMPVHRPGEDEFEIVHDASALFVLKGDIPGVVELVRHTRLECAAGEPIPALQPSIPPIGSEFVMLLYRMEAEGRSSAWSPDPTFPVRNGRVDTHGFNALPPEMDLEAFKAALLRLTQ